MKEIQAWSMFRQGDRNAFKWLYRHFAAMLYNYGTKFTKDTELVEDSIQDLFVELWETRERLSDTTSVKFYLYRALRRRIARQSVFTKRFTNTFTDNAVLISQSSEFYLMIEQADSVKKQILENSLNQLSARQREILYLKYFDELTFPQIADIMQIDLKSTYKLMYKALAAIKQKLSLHPVQVQTITTFIIASLFMLML